MKVKKALLLLSGLAYITWAIAVFIAAACCDKSEDIKGATLDKKIAYIDTAIRLDSLNAKYHYRRFELSKGAGYEYIREAIALEPSNPFYHMKYGLSLMKYAKDALHFEVALEEIKKAYELKPYSSLYKSIYDKFSAMKRP